MEIDCWGRTRGDPLFGMNQPREGPLQWRRAGGAAYLRFRGASPGGDAVHRLRGDGGGPVAHDWAPGSWDDAESLRYRPLEETAEVEP